MRIIPISISGENNSHPVETNTQWKTNKTDKLQTHANASLYNVGLGELVLFSSSVDNLAPMC